MFNLIFLYFEIKFKNNNPIINLIQNQNFPSEEKE